MSMVEILNFVILDVHFFYSDFDETRCTKFDDAVQVFGGLFRSEKCKKVFGQ